MSRHVSTAVPAFVPPVLSGWANPRGPVTDVAEAAFLAGAAVGALDQLVRAQPAWAGAWRQRLALKCAASACRLLGRSEDEADLRDAWYLRKASDDPSPAGNVYRAFRQQAARPTALDADSLAQAVEGLGLRKDDRFANLPVELDELVRTGRPAPFAAAEMAQRVVEAAPDAEPLAWWVADMTLAAKLRWPRPVPLLMAQAFGPAFRAASGSRIRPGEDGFAGALCLGLAQGAAEACRTAGEVARRAERLEAVTPKLRAKGAGDAIKRLLEDDAVPGTLTTARLSRFAARRLFERLDMFEAVRELSGRSSFRLYGL
ncbi:MAG: DUF1403 family protein [Proteobacteria bacterium]|nr:DUF1403 family protein [Pseudomonadota bacterium]